MQSNHNIFSDTIVKVFTTDTSYLDCIRDMKWVEAEKHLLMRLQPIVEEEFTEFQDRVKHTLQQAAEDPEVTKFKVIGQVIQVNDRTNLVLKFKPVSDTTVPTTTHGQD